MCLRSKSGREQIETFSSGNQLSMRNLSQKSLLSIRVPLPPPEEVEAAVTATNQLHALADQLEARLTIARKVVDRLTPALLAKAFRGELVPQDPGDEPASALLERIRAARQAEAGAGKPSRRGRPKAAANPDQLPLDAAPVPPDFLAGLLRECGPLSERALLAVSELEPQRFQQQLYRELESGTAREVQDNGQVLLEAVG
jgi:type I restriction enzyme S subunit